MTAEDIINDILKKRKMARADLLCSQTPRFVRARLLTIHELRRAGFSKSAIARAMNKTNSGLNYWFGDGWKRQGNRWLGIADGTAWNSDTNSIVLQVCNEHKIYPAEFFGKGRDKRLTAARREAIQRLSDAGFILTAIARLTKLNISTVRYWTRPKYRAYSMQSARKSLARSIERLAT